MLICEGDRKMLSENAEKVEPVEWETSQYTKYLFSKHEDLSLDLHGCRSQVWKCPSVASAGVRKVRELIVQPV